MCSPASIRIPALVSCPEDPIAKEGEVGILGPGLCCDPGAPRYWHPFVGHRPGATICTSLPSVLWAWTLTLAGGWG